MLITAFPLYFVALTKGHVAQHLCSGPFVSRKEAELDRASRAEAHRYKVVETAPVVMSEVQDV